jgi:competence protein ComEC
MSRPLVVLTGCFICGISFGHYLNLPIFLLILVSAVLLLLSIIRFYFHRDISILLLVLVFVTGIVHIERTETKSQLLLSHVETIAAFSPVELTGRVVDSSSLSAGKVNLTVDHVRFLYNGTWNIFPGKILVTLSSVTGKPNYFYGDRVWGYGLLDVAPEPSNPGEFDYRDYLVQDGIYGIFKCWQPSDIRLSKVQNRSCLEHILRFASKVKQYFVATNSATLPSIHAALLNGIVLGEKSELADDIKDAFIRCGIFHLLVVSGSNVMLVAFLVYVFLKLFRVKRRIAALVSIPLIILYAMVVGYQPPVSRAIIMTVLVLLGLVAKQDVQVINNLGIAAFIALLFNPMDIFNASFQLSFITILSIVLIYPILVSWYPFPKKLLPVQLILYSSIAAFIGIAPLSAYYFNVLPLISPITNLIAGPIVSIILPAGFLSGFIYPLSPAISQLVANTNWLLLSILINVVQFLYFIPGSYYYIGKPALWVIGVYYILLLGFIHSFYPTEFAPDYTVRKKWLFATLSFILILFILTSFHPWNRTLQITFLSVGQGDSMVLQFPNGKTRLIDGGEYLAGKRNLVPYLRRQGITQLDTIILTHPHNDHVGGLINVLNNFSIGRVVDSKQEQFDPEYYPKFNEIIQQKKIPVQKAVRGANIPTYSGATIRIFNPPVGFLKNFRSEVNNNAIVLQVIYGRVTAMFTGDIEQEAESDLMRTGFPLGATILKVPHHGSATSNATSFLQEVHPQIAVISVGKNNWFNLPSLKIIDKLNQMNSQIYRTDLDGAIIIRTDGKKVEVQKMKS